MDAEELGYGFGLGGVDPASLGGALGEAALRLAQKPDRLLRGLGELAVAETAVALDVSRTLLGSHDAPVAAPEPGDRRFADRAWKENPLLRGTMESYVVSSRWARRMLDAAELPPTLRRKASFALDIVLDAAAPTNVPWLNPEAVKEAIDTGGLSAARGLGNLVDDLLHNNGRPQQVDRDAFEVGKTLAATAGRVVFRNDLIELIAYEPQTEMVFAQPIVYSPPWINKYYVLDLAPGRSFIEHAVQAGFTVFAISYRNPDASMANVQLDDYLRDGLFAALEQASALTGSPAVNILAVCIGGTLTTMGLGVLATRGEAERVGWATLLNTLVDYSDPGAIGAFTDERTIARIERRNQRRGYLSQADMEWPFNLMRSNDLIWRYVVSNWYMGRKPPAFDILAWNADSTRLPAAMHSQFLRACYLENRLTRPGALELDGTSIDLSHVETPLYVLASETDHIAPWQAVYRTIHLVAGSPRFVLSSGGHIAGMVNPPGGKKARFHLNAELPADANAWLAGAERIDGSWWDDWVAWAAERSGERVAPPELPAGEPAPGSYVLG